MVAVVVTISATVAATVVIVVIVIVIFLLFVDVRVEEDYPLLVLLLLPPIRSDVHIEAEKMTVTEGGRVF